MKKIVSLLLAFAMIMAMTGCASMLKAAGGVSKTELAAQNAAVDEKLNAVNARIETINAALAKTESMEKELEGLKATLAQLSTDLGNAKLTADELEKAKATIGELTAKINTLSDETLLKLAQLIQNALTVAEAK